MSDIPDFTFDLVSGPTMTFVSGSISASAYLTSNGRLGFGMDSAVPSVDYAELSKSTLHVDSKNIDIISSGSSNQDGTGAGGLLFSEHFLSNTVASINNFTVTNVNGAGSVCTLVTGSAGHPGVIQITAGTTTTGRASINTLVNCIRFGSGSYNTEADIFVPTLSTPTNRYTLYFGFADNVAAGDMINGAYFQYTNTASQYWQIKTANNSSRTTLDTSVVASIGWTKFRVEVRNDTSANFYINDILVGGIPLNIPSTVGREVGIIIKIEKATGATTSYVLVDYVKLAFN